MVETEKKSYWGMAARECDSCRSSPSLLFCRTHAAFLCGPCDSLVHVTGSSPHERVWMCEVCEQAPAAFTCKPDAATLCVNCDSDIHSANPLSQRHDRSATVPFFQPLSSIVGPNFKLHRSKGITITDFLIKPNEDDEEEEEGEKKVVVGDQYFFSSAGPFLDLEYGSSLMELTGKSGNCSDSVVPVQKPINYHQHQHDVVPFLAGGSYQSDSYSPQMVQSVSSSDVGVVPEASAEITNSYGYSYGGPLAGVAQQDLTESPAMAAVPLTGKERVARVMRYREKKKNRKFEKTIRYASRKAYAEKRPRIKGRFAKRTPELDDSVDGIYASSAAAVSALMMETGYVVVPSY